MRPLPADVGVAETAKLPRSIHFVDSCFENEENCVILQQLYVQKLLLSAC